MDILMLNKLVHYIATLRSPVKYNDEYGFDIHCLSKDDLYKAVPALNMDKLLSLYGEAGFTVKITNRYVYLDKGVLQIFCNRLIFKYVNKHLVNTKFKNTLTFEAIKGFIKTSPISDIANCFLLVNQFGDLAEFISKITWFTDDLYEDMPDEGISMLNMFRRHKMFGFNG